MAAEASAKVFPLVRTGIIIKIKYNMNYKSLKKLKFMISCW